MAGETPLAATAEQATRVFQTGATRDGNVNQKLGFEGFISPYVLQRYAEYMHKCRTRNVPLGETLRAPDNWQKGIPRETYAESLIRHTVEFWQQYDAGRVDQDTLCAIMFNVMGYLFEDLIAKGAADRPTTLNP